jgi:hypothetical protein
MLYLYIRELIKNIRFKKRIKSKIIKSRTIGNNILYFLS